jgi:hypothetical protein
MNDLSDRQGGDGRLKMNERAKRHAQRWGASAGCFDMLAEFARDEIARLPTRDAAEGAGCEQCNGSGRDTARFNHDHLPCPQCRGTGKAAPPKPAPDAMREAPNTWGFAIGQRVIRLEVRRGEETLSLIAELPLGEQFEQIAECICYFHNSYFRTPALAAPVPPADGAIEAARQEIVLAIAFLGRDSGTDRLQATVDALIPGLAKADAILRGLPADGAIKKYKCSHCGEISDAPHDGACGVW